MIIVLSGWVGLSNESSQPEEFAVTTHGLLAPFSTRFLKDRNLFLALNYFMNPFSLESPKPASKLWPCPLKQEQRTGQKM